MSDSQRLSTKSSGHVSRSSTSKRTTSALPKPPVSVHESAIIANHAVLTGHHTITIMAGAIIHPQAKIYSLHGPVVIDEGCIVYEAATVGISELEGDHGRGVMLDKNVVVESGAVVEAALVGESTVIGTNVKVGFSAVVGKFCHISPGTSLAPGAELADFTVLYGPNSRRPNATLETREKVMQLRKRAHSRQLYTQAKLIPNNSAKWQ
ncbi:trimeric LpxA-like protein [Phyllosticta capitalensis]|uniref:trimeric LpxA-like protein n=1 Tax=Phyllosticta capitalensis TaxID=121624 RepID=UPI003130294D